MDLINIRNTSTDRDIVLHHDLHGQVTIKPGRDRIVPIGYALIHFGNPKARGEDREYEYKLARQLHGFYSGVTPENAWEHTVKLPELLWGLDDNEKSTIGPLMPPFECYDLDDNRVYFVLDDPDGSRGSGEDVAQSEDAASNAFLRKQVEELQQAQERLLSRIVAQENGDLPMPVADEGADADGDADEGQEQDAANGQEQKATGKAQTAAAQEAAGERSEGAAALPKPKATTVKKDGPQTSRVGTGRTTRK